MSFWDLWDNFAKVKENSEDTKNIIYYLIEFLNHKTDLEREYANGLQRLTRASLFIRGKNTMIPCLKRLQTICNQQFLSLQELINHQQTDLIPALKDLLTAQDEVVKIKAKYGKDFDYELQKHFSNCEKAKDYYFSLCNTCEIPNKKEENAGKKYLKTVEDANKFLAVYEENMMPVFMLYQKHEDEKIMTIKDVLRKLIIYELSYIRNIQYEKDMMPIAIDALNPEIEIKKFIDDNCTGKMFSKVMFEVHPKRLNTDLLTNSSECDKKASEVLGSIADKCWKGITIDDEDNRNFNDVIASAEGRKVWIQRLTEKKFEGKMMVPSCTFGIVCGLISSLLDVVKEFQDLHCAKHIIFLSQFFYEETMSQKTFMYQLILTHPLWEDFKIWGNLIIISVNIEIESDAKICAEDSTSLSQALKLRPVLSSKVNSYVMHMKNFMVGSHVLEKTMKLIQEYYNVKLEEIKVELL